jgi:hypothetical protein
VGCIVFVLSVAIGPFTQQAVKAVPCDQALKSDDASIRVSRWMHGSNLSRMSPGFWDLDMDTKVAILDGLANPNTSRSKILPGCISANCTFHSYNDVTHSSIGMCRKCIDTTPWVTEVFNSSAFFHTNGGTHRGHFLVLPNDSGVG